MKYDKSTLKKRIAELEKAYLELHKSKDELIQSEKLAFTGRIAASIAHEIKNPLANVTMSLHQLAKTFKLDERQVKYLDVIIRNVDRVNFLITELLNCARPQRLQMRPYDIHRVLNNVLELTRPKRRMQKITLEKRFTTKHPVVRIDRDHMGRALSNIVDNAIEAMPNKGKLTIATELNGGFFVVKIQDTGKGISKEDIIKLFEPFYTTKGNGIGLGLSICYGIIASHGGTIEVESKMRKGSVFTVSLPVGGIVGIHG